MTGWAARPTWFFIMKKHNNVAASRFSSLALVSLLGVSLQACFLVPGGEGLEISDDLGSTDDACLSHCEEQNGCTDFVRDCESVCDLREEMDCSEETAAFDQCLQESGDVCGAPPECAELADSAVQCMLDFCEQNPGADGCPKSAQ